jgi:hypothetical protein
MEVDMGSHQHASAAQAPGNPIVTGGSLAGYVARHADPQASNRLASTGARPMCELLDATWVQVTCPQVVVRHVESEREVLEAAIRRISRNTAAALVERDAPGLDGSMGRLIALCLVFVVAHLLLISAGVVALVGLF